MSRLFAFNKAEEMVVYPMPAGRYDAGQQLWVADEASYANQVAPDMDATYLNTASVTGDPRGWDVECEIAFD